MQKHGRTKAARSPCNSVTKATKKQTPGKKSRDRGLRNHSRKDPSTTNDWTTGFRCPLTGKPFEDPVVAADGETYERHAIQRWLFEPSPGFPKGHFTSPVTRERLAHRELVANRAAARGVAAGRRVEQLLEAHGDAASQLLLSTHASSSSSSAPRFPARDEEPFESIPYEELRLGDPLRGVQGGTSDTMVLKGRWSGQRAALAFRGRPGDPAAPFLTARNAAVLWRLRTHPNIVDFVGVSVSRTPVDCQVVVSELVPEGDLARLLRGLKAAAAAASAAAASASNRSSKGSGADLEGASEAVRLELASQVSSAALGLVLAGLADTGSLGLALDRVLVASWQPRKPGRTLVKVLPWRAVAGCRAGGTWQSRGLEARRTAPEALSHAEFGEPAAAWSLGVLLWEIFTDGQLPYWWVESEDAVVAGLVDGRLNLPKPGTQGSSAPQGTLGCPASVWQAISSCLLHDPTARPRVGDVARDLARAAADAAAAARAAALNKRAAAAVAASSAPRRRVVGRSPGRPNIAASSPREKAKVTHGKRGTSRRDVPVREERSEINTSDKHVSSDNDPPLSTPPAGGSVGIYAAAEAAGSPATEFYRRTPSERSRRAHIERPSPPMTTASLRRSWAAHDDGFSPPPAMHHSSSRVTPVWGDDAPGPDRSSSAHRPRMSAETARRELARLEGFMKGSYGSLGVAAESHAPASGGSGVQSRRNASSSAAAAEHLEPGLFGDADAQGLFPTRRSASAREGGIEALTAKLSELERRL